MQLQEAYRTLQGASGIEVGDKVRVLRRAKDHEMGWDNSWIDDRMDRFIGGVYEVAVVDEDGIRFSSSVGPRFSFPFFVLEVVEKANPPIRIGSYTVGFRDGGEVGVGCQDIPFEQIEAIYNRARELRNEQE